MLLGHEAAQDSQVQALLPSLCVSPGKQLTYTTHKKGETFQIMFFCFSIFFYPEFSLFPDALELQFLLLVTFC